MDSSFMFETCGRAERIKMIGHYPVGSLSEALNLATISEVPSELNSTYTGGLIGDAISYYEKQHWLFSAYFTNYERVSMNLFTLTR